MKKYAFITMIVSVMSTVLFAQIATNTTPHNVGKVMDPATKAKLLAITGGFIQMPAKGSVLRVINSQSRISPQDLQQMVALLKGPSRIPITLSESTGKDVNALAKAAASQAETLGAVVLCDAKTLPAFLVAPEEGWAAINVDALAQDASPAVLKARVSKELWRTLGYLLGVASADRSMMGTVKTVSDLDAITGQMLNGENLLKIQQNAVKLGVTPARTSTYKKACEEGWAPMPTNNFQKAIWEEVKAKKATNTPPSATK